MGRKRGRRDSTDLTIYPPPDVYVPPPRHECTFYDSEIDLELGEQSNPAEVHVLYEAQYIYQGRVVWFCLEQKLRCDGQEHAIERVDTCHGTVHRHRFDRAGDELSPEHISHISLERGHHEVDAAFDEHYEALLSRWDENVRRWRRT